MKLQGKRIIVLVDEGFEDLEFWVPLMRLQEEGAETTVAGIQAGRTVRSKSGGLTATVGRSAGELDPDQYDGIVVPGGWAPDRLRPNSTPAPPAGHAALSSDGEKRVLDSALAFPQLPDQIRARREVGDRDVALGRLAERDRSSGHPDPAGPADHRGR